MEALMLGVMSQALGLNEPPLTLRVIRPSFRVVKK